MEAVILIGLQGSGKSTFCRQQLYDSHVRINLDMLRTRHREESLLNTCLLTQQAFVIDNTNPTREERAKYIAAAKAAKFSIIGYYFASNIEACKRRNEQRLTNQQVPLKGLLGTYSRLELPQADEGFDRLHYVTIAEGGSFVVAEWNHEI